MKHILLTLKLIFLKNISIASLLFLLFLFNVSFYSQAITLNGTGLNYPTTGGSPNSCNDDYEVKNVGIGAPTETGGCITMTDGSLVNASTAVWICTPLDLTLDFNLTFDANFGNNINSGDGLVFVMDGDPATLEIGGDGGNLGYNTISPSIGVEFDTWPDADISCDHAEIHQNGIISNISNPVPLKSCCGTVKDGNDYSICISWDVSTQTLTATFEGNLVGQYVGDITSILGTSAPIWGFTSGCGAGGQTQKICNAVMSNSISTIAGCNTCTPPVITASPNPDTICSGETLNISISGSAGTNYCWQATNNLNVNGETSILTQESSASFSIQETLTNGVPGNQTVIYTIYPESSSGCMGPPLIVTVNVMDVNDPFCNCTPNLIVNSLPPICDGFSLDLANAVDPSSDLLGNNLIYYSSLTDAINSTNSISSIVSNSGTYYIRLENGSDPSCFVIETFTLSVNPLPTPDAGPDLSICLGESVTIGANPVWGNQGDSYSWDNGAGSGIIDLTGGSQDNGQATVSPISNISYIISITDANGCIGADDIVVTVNALPTVSAGSNQVICEGASVTLSGSGANSYLWDNGVSDGMAFTPSLGAITYTVTGTDLNLCENTDQVVVTVNPLPDAGSNGAITLCATDPATDLFNELGGTPDVGGVWSPAMSSGTGIFDPAVDVGGTYTYTVTNSCGTATADVVVTVTTNPDPGTNGTLTICSNDPSTDLFSQLGGTPDAGGVWSPAMSSGTGIFDPAVDPAGTYTYSLNACGGGTLTSEVVVTINISSLNTTSISICQGDSIFLDGAYQYTSGTYADSLSSIYGCDSIIITILSVDPVSDATIISDSVFCNNDPSADLMANSIGGMWSGNGIINASTGTFDPSVAIAGTHQISYTISGVCGDSDTVNILVHDSPVNSFVYYDDSCQLSIGSIDLNIVGGDQPYVINRSNGSVTEDLSELFSGSYWVTVIDNNNCIKSDTIYIGDDLLNCSGDLWIPNIFSPNNDLLNDVLYVRGAATTSNFIFLIFNRWGEKVFESSNPNTGWDGTFNGKEMNDGVFAYMVNATLMDGSEVSIKGTVTLVK